MVYKLLAVRALTPAVLTLLLLAVRSAHADNPKAVCADFNGDGNVGIVDIALVVARFGTTEDAEDWDPKFDISGDLAIAPSIVFEGDGVINLFDVATTAAQFGKT